MKRKRRKRKKKVPKDDGEDADDDDEEEPEPEPEDDDDEEEAESEVEDEEEIKEPVFVEKRPKKQPKEKLLFNRRNEDKDLITLELKEYNDIVRPKFNEMINLLPNSKYISLKCDGLAP